MRCHKRPYGDQAYVVLSGEQVNCGKWKSKKAKAEYERLIAEWVGRGRKPKPPAADATIMECCDAFTYHCKDYFRDSPKSYERILLALSPLLKLYGRMIAADFSAVHLRVIRETMINDSLSVTTINTRINVIRRMLRHCASIEMMPAEPWHKATTLEKPKTGKDCCQNAEEDHACSC